MDTIGIIKICKKHGKLTLEQVRPHVSSVNGKTYYDCRQCDREQARQWSKDNRKRINARRKEIYVPVAKILPDGFVKECQYHGYLTLEQVKTPGNNGVKHECLQCRKNYDGKSYQIAKQQVEMLHDDYIIRLIQEKGRKKGKKQKSILSVADIKKVPILIDLKRAALKIKRELNLRKEPKGAPTFEHSKENVKKAIAASVLARTSKTHCKNGHPLNEKRKCMICNTETKRRLKGHLPREIAATIMVDSSCNKCGAPIKVCKLGNKRKVCQQCKKEYMKNYDANRRKPREEVYDAEH